jgi:hypothetical protein
MISPADRAAKNLLRRLYGFPWVMSVDPGYHVGRECVIVYTSLAVPAEHRWLIPSTHLGVPVVHRPLSSPRP